MEENIIKVSSVYIFKHIYNLVCEEKAKNYKIPEIVDNYDLNKCINDNISDINSRYLLLEIKSNLSSLIVQNIKVQNPEKKDKINFLNGSPFPEDNNNEYKLGKIIEIQDCAAEPDKIMILQNLNSIQPYLYDLYNMNYKIIDEQKYVRICLENFSEQDTPVSDQFRIIILVDRKFLDSVDTAFLNRLEKMKINFSDLLNDEQKVAIKIILKKIELIETVKKRKINYDLKNLLINCDEEDIGGLVYNSFIENKKEKKNLEDIEDRIYIKLSNILPQDIIAILKDENIIKQKYYEKNYYNFKTYIDDIKSKKNNYKISIIYTFSNVASVIEGCINDMKFMISEIKSENQLKNRIEEMKSNEISEDQTSKIIIIHFEQFNSNKIQFVSDYIINYFKDDKYNYIFLVHIARRFLSENQGNKERIYSIPNIDNDINQLFIDNLNGPSNITLKNILTKSIKEIMSEAGFSINEEIEFKTSLLNFVYKGINEINKTRFLDNLNEDEYSNELLKYMENNKEFKKSLITKAKELIDEDKNAKGDCGSLIDKILKENYINKNSVDLISCIIDYINDNIFNKNLEKIFTFLEHNNFLTTLLEIDNNINQNILGKDIIKELKDIILSKITTDEEKLEPKFLFGYKIPGFFNFYKNLSEAINKNITVNFLNNEKNLREYLGSKPEKMIEDFHEKEELLLNEVLEEININKTKFGLYLDLINRISPELVLNDYIIFYLDKYLGIGKHFESCSKIIELLLKLRFSEEKNQIIYQNESEPIKILLIKIIWIESNINYIKNILNAFEHAKNIINQDYEGNIIYKMVEDLINDKNVIIKYIVNPGRNPEHTTEVNECFYILLASLCLNITSEKIKLTDLINPSENINRNEINIMDYYGRLKEINNILQNLNNDLLIFLNELYIIDELIKIIDYNALSIKTIEEIRKYLRKSALIIQNGKKNYLGENLKSIYNLLKGEKRDENKDIKFYDMLKYIFLKEIKKLNDINYRTNILDMLIKEKDVTKKSNDIFQILLKSYIKEFKNTQKNLLDGKGSILQLLDKHLSDEKQIYYFTLSETLLYFFEKNSLIYLKNNAKSLEKDPTDIFKECFKYLNDDFETAEKYYGKLIHITKIFCLGYIKAFCHMFIRMHDKSEFDPKKIIEVINKYDKYNIVKLIKIYIYKIIYNQNNKRIDSFLRHSIKEKYKLSKYKDFKKFIKFKEEDQINFGIENLDNDNYKKVYDILEKYKNDGYKNKIEEEDINEINNDGEDNKLRFDNFYLVAYNLILSKLNKKDFDPEIYNNFYNNICEPLFKKTEDEEENNKLFSIIQILFNFEKYSKIKSDYKIESKNIDALLYGYRYCLNELAEEYEKGEYIYSSLYNKSKTGYLKEKLYPGSDTKDEPYYELYYKIENHFKQKPKEGCYICLCKIGYYHSIPSGFPGQSEKDLKCPNCGKEIGSKEKYLEEKDGLDEKGNKMILSYEPIERKDYCRIFYDDDEYDTLNGNRDKRNMLKKINYMTRETFKQTYIEPLYKKEKGLNKIDENKFKNGKKIIRNLSQISYRLLNYILYSHLFFAKLITDSNHFDDYLPNEVNIKNDKKEGKGIMPWFSTIKECFILLQNELEKEGIKKTEIFMEVVFKDLFNKMHDKECIDKYDELIDFEDDLEQIIQEKIKKAKELIDKFEEIEKENCKDKESAMALLKELYDKDDYDKKEYPYYEYFYYSDYPDESYIKEILEHKDKDEYPILIKYLENKKHSKNENELYSSDNLILFNKVLNLFKDQFSHKIIREKAENLKINNIEIYQQNSELINKFIELYNKFEFKYKDLNINKNYLCDFVLDENNKYGKTYIKIYGEFVKKQNKKLEALLDIKSKQGIYNSNCMTKINIQRIKEDEIFTYNVFKKLNFYEVMFNSSYRKVIDTLKYENYNEFEIFLDLLEEEMTDLLLGNKKLLNSDLIGFKYKDEEFSYQLNDLITNFESKYNTQDIDNNDKLVIYDFIITYDGNNIKYKNIINDFEISIDYLYKIKTDENEKIKIDENTKIYEVVENLKSVTDDFKKIFKEKNNLIVRKISKIYDYYLKLLFKYVKKDLENYQEKKVIEDNKIDSTKPDKEKKAEKEEKPKYNLDDKTIKKLDEIFSKEDLTITKESLAEALRLFMSIILYREKEKEKENKIKLNKNNIVGYLKEQDLWENNHIKIKDEKFSHNLSKIKSLNIKIKEILWLYYYLTDNTDEDFENDIKEKYKKYLEGLRKKEKSIKITKDSKKSDDESESESHSQSNKIDSNNSSRSNSKNSSRSNSRNSSRSNSKNSSRSNSKNSSKSNSRKSSVSASRKSSISNESNSEDNKAKDSEDRD